MQATFQPWLYQDPTLPLAVAGDGDYLPGPVAEVNTSPPRTRAGDTAAALLQPLRPEGGGRYKSIVQSRARVGHLPAPQLLPQYPQGLSPLPTILPSKDTV